MRSSSIASTGPASRPFPTSCRGIKPATLCSTPRAPSGACALDCNRELDATSSPAPSVFFDASASVALDAGVVELVVAVAGLGDIVVAREETADVGSSSVMASVEVSNRETTSPTVSLADVAAMRLPGTSTALSCMASEAGQLVGGDRVPVSSGHVEKL